MNRGLIEWAVVIGSLALLFGLPLWFVMLSHLIDWLEKK